jgi:hypothetical protein
MLVMVFWEDASFSLDDESPPVYNACTVGFLLESTNDYITVAGEELVSEDHQFNRSVTTIPKRSVVRICELKYPSINA